MFAAHALAKENYPWASMDPDEFLRRIEAIALHGDLRDVRFVEYTLQLVFEPREAIFHAGDRRDVGEIIYEPKGNFYAATPQPLTYAITTGRLPIFAFLKRPLLATFQFEGLQNYLCVRSSNIQRLFDGRYTRLSMGLWVEPRYGYNLFRNEEYSINFEVFPASPESADCIQFLELYQSEWIDSVPRDGTSP